MFFYSESDQGEATLAIIQEDPYFYNTSLLLKMDSDFSDSSVHQHAVATGGNVSVSNSEFKYDGGSGYFDGNTNTGVSFPSSDSLDLRNTDWTMEAWINPDGNYADHRMIISKRNGSSTVDYHFYLSMNTGEIRFWNGATAIGSGVTPPTNQWTHVALARKDGVVTIYVNGEAKASQALGIVNHRSVPVGIGNTGTLDRYPFRGYIDDVRITKGVARYTTNFTPPDSHPTTGPSEIVSTDLQLHLDAGDTNSYPGNGTTWFDLSGNGYHHALTNPTYEEFTGAYSFNMNEDGKLIVHAGNTFTYGEQYTIQVWAAALSDSEVSYWRTLLRSYPNDHALLIQDNTNTIGYYDNDNGGGFVSYGLNAGTLGLENNWALYTIVGNAGSTTLHINGLSHSATVPKTLSGNQHDTIGGTHEIHAWQPFGRIAVVTSYSRALSNAEVLQNYNATKTRFGL